MKKVSIERWDASTPVQPWGNFDIWPTRTRHVPEPPYSVYTKKRSHSHVANDFKQNSTHTTRLLRKQQIRFWEWLSVNILRIDEIYTNECDCSRSHLATWPQNTIETHKRCSSTARSLKLLVRVVSFSKVCTQNRIVHTVEIARDSSSWHPRRVHEQAPTRYDREHRHSAAASIESRLFVIKENMCTCIPLTA